MTICAGYSSKFVSLLRQCLFTSLNEWRKKQSSCGFISVSYARYSVNFNFFFVKLDPKIYMWFIFLISKTLHFSKMNNFSRLFTGRPGFCYLPRLTGNCRGRFLSYFYDGVSRRCRAFFYSGCQGNENRFQNLQECQRICGNGGAGL